MFYYDYINKLSHKNKYYYSILNKQRKWKTNYKNNSRKLKSIHFHRDYKTGNNPVHCSHLLYFSSKKRGSYVRDFQKNCENVFRE